MSNLKLPSGKVLSVSNIPEDITQQELQDILILNGKATIEDFSVPVETVAEDPSMLESVGQYLKANMELPLGIGGSIAGAAAGAPLGPAGMLVGGILGGATFSAGGSLLSNVFEGAELDFADATNEFLLSAGFDVATLGLGKVIKPGYFAAKAALGFTPKEVAEDIIKSAKQGAEVGSIESLRASQNILQQKGASLTRFQTGQASAIEVFSERLAQAGLLSGKEIAENADKVNKAAQDSLNDIVNKVDYSLGDDPARLGEAMYDVINAGRQALNDTYGAGLDSITQSVKNSTVNTAGIKKRLQQYLKDNTEISTGTVLKGGKEVVKKKGNILLEDDTINYINKLLKGPLELGSISADALLKLDKQLSAQIRNFGDKNSPNYNTIADRELGQLTDILKDSFINTLKQADPKAADEYAKLKTYYKEGRSGLLPDINKSFIRNAEKGNYDQLGKMLVSQDNVSKVNNFMKSVDEAYKQIEKSGEGVSKVGYATAKDAKQAIKQSFLKNIFPDVQDSSFDINKYKQLSKQFSKPAQAARLKAVTGDDYGRVKQIFNLMAEASKKPESNLGTLVLRGKEYAALGSIFTGVGGLAGTVSAGLILATPVVLAKMAANPKAVNKLLAFEKTTFKNDGFREKAAALIVGDFMNALTKEEQAEIRNSFREQQQ